MKLLQDKYIQTMKWQDAIDAVFLKLAVISLCHRCCLSETGCNQPKCITISEQLLLQINAIVTPAQLFC